MRITIGKESRDAFEDEEAVPSMSRCYCSILPSIQVDLYYSILVLRMSHTEAAVRFVAINLIQILFGSVQPPTIR